MNHTNVAHQRRLSQKNINLQHQHHNKGGTSSIGHINGTLGNILGGAMMAAQAKVSDFHNSSNSPPKKQHKYRSSVI